MDPDADIELAYHTYSQLLSTLPDMDIQGLQFIGPITTEYKPSSDLLVESTGPQALDPANPANGQLLMIQAEGRSYSLYSHNTPLSSGKRLPTQFLLASST